jgi:hypothetical protein
MMKQLFLAALLVAVATPALADNVSVTIGVNQPGLYGQITIGDYPQPPPVIYARPVVIAQAPEFANEPPIYLHVPPGHEKHWGRHCAEYHACGRRVFFVQHDWYANEYAPRHRHGEGDREHGHGKHEGRDHEHGRGEGRDRDDRDH